LRSISSGDDIVYGFGFIFDNILSNYQWIHDNYNRVIFKPTLRHYN